MAAVSRRIRVDDALCMAGPSPIFLTQAEGGCQPTIFECHVMVGWRTPNAQAMGIRASVATRAVDFSGCCACAALRRCGRSCASAAPWPGPGAQAYRRKPFISAVSTFTSGSSSATKCWRRYSTIRVGRARLSPSSRCVATVLLPPQRCGIVETAGDTPALREKYLKSWPGGLSLCRYLRMMRMRQ
jgi:hypothetical protein